MERLASHPKACLSYLASALEKAASPAEFNALIVPVSKAATEFYKGGQASIVAYRQRIEDPEFKGLHWGLASVLEAAVPRFERFALEAEESKAFAHQLEMRFKHEPAAKLRFTAAFHNVLTADDFIEAFRWAQRVAPNAVDPIFNREKAGLIARFLSLEPPPSMDQQIRLIGYLFRFPQLQDQMWPDALRAASTAEQYLEGAKRLGLESVTKTLDRFVSLKPTTEQIKALHDLFPKAWAFHGQLKSAVSGEAGPGTSGSWGSALCRFASRAIGWVSAFGNPKGS